MVSIGLKASGCLCMIAGASGFGAWLAGNYGRRLAALEQLRRMIFLLKGQILYANAPLEEAFEAVGRRTDGFLAQLFLRVAARIGSQQGEPFAVIWAEEVEKTEEDSVLSKSDKHSLASLGEHLGFMDREMQERNLLLYLEQLDLSIEQLRTHKQERCRLYTSLGVMSGMFLAILLC